jgi:hypothetical protein
MIDPSETNEHRVAMTVHSLSGAMGELQNLVSNKQSAYLLREEYSDLIAARDALNDLVAKITQKHLQAAE